MTFGRVLRSYTPGHIRGCLNCQHGRSRHGEFRCCRDHSDIQRHRLGRQAEVTVPPMIRYKRPSLVDGLSSRWPKTLRFRLAIPCWQIVVQANLKTWIVRINCYTWTWYNVCIKDGKWIGRVGRISAPHRIQSAQNNHIAPRKTSIGVAVVEEMDEFAVVDVIKAMKRGAVAEHSRHTQQEKEQDVRRHWDWWRLWSVSTTHAHAHRKNGQETDLSRVQKENTKNQDQETFIMCVTAMAQEACRAASPPPVPFACQPAHPDWPTNHVVDSMPVSH